jgi:hypothetical protein
VFFSDCAFQIHLITPSSLPFRELLSKCDGFALEMLTRLITPSIPVNSVALIPLLRESWMSAASGLTHREKGGDGGRNLRNLFRQETLASWLGIQNRIGF